MKFGMINLLNAVIVIIMMVPNLIYAGKGGEDQKTPNKLTAVIEQVGRYGSMALMILPLGVWKFGFPSVAAMLVYLFGNGVCLLAYLTVWAFYFKKKTFHRAMALAILPVCMFGLCGICLHHWLLVAAAALFGIGHLRITYQNSKNRNYRSAEDLL